MQNLVKQLMGYLKKIQVFRNESGCFNMCSQMKELSQIGRSVHEYLLLSYIGFSFDYHHKSIVSCNIEIKMMGE